MRDCKNTDLGLIFFNKNYFYIFFQVWLFDFKIKLKTCFKKLFIKTVKNSWFYSFRQGTGIISCSYDPHKNNISKHNPMLSKNLDLHSSYYGNNIIIGDLNVWVGEQDMNYFCDLYNLNSLIKELTWDNPPKSVLHWAYFNKFTL